MADIRDHDLNVTVVVQVARGRRYSAQRTCEGTSLMIVRAKQQPWEQSTRAGDLVLPSILSSLQGPARRKAVRHDFEKSGNSLVNFV